ncbi:MAG: rhomboid family intramembrane serine protease [Candidatus Paceibacterota bacterium]
MFPIKDTSSTRKFPFVNYIIILANIVVFIVEITAPDIQEFITLYSFIPGEFIPYLLATYKGIFTSMWLHGGWFHLLSNMWFLHIFGDNIEDRVGHFRYFLFYLSAGVAATLAQYVIDPFSFIPMVGASGAISGIAGAYVVLFRHSRIQALIPTFFGFWDIVELPSWIFLGYWLVIQVFSGIGSVVVTSAGEGGVAFFAHIGGFVFGWLIAKNMYKKKRPSLRDVFDYN